VKLNEDEQNKQENGNVFGPQILHHAVCIGHFVINHFNHWCFDRGLGCMTKPKKMGCDKCEISISLRGRIYYTVHKRWRGDHSSTQVNVFCENCYEKMTN
jgi:hypothetical protein